MNSEVVTREDLKNVFGALGEGDYGTRIDDLESKQPKWRTLYNGVGYKATTTGWENTGLTVTIPSGHAYLVLVSPSYNTGIPTGCGFHLSTSSFSSYGMPNYYVGGYEKYCGRGTFLMTAGTYNYYEKRSSVPSTANAIYMSCIDFDFS